MDKVPGKVVGWKIKVVSTCNKIGGLLRRFWWGRKENERLKVLLLSWDVICRRKTSEYDVWQILTRLSGKRS